MEDLGASLLVVSLETQALQREESRRTGVAHIALVGIPRGDSSVFTSG